MAAGFGFGWEACVLALACAVTVNIRLYAVNVFGRVIHEFDPWFTYRATQELAAHGPAEFARWFDERSWYPLGRPVGPTVYPGLMYTAWGIHAFLARVGAAMSLNDVCFFLPAGFAVVTTCLVYLLALEASGTPAAAAYAACFVAIVPAHTMRSVAGAYDNEAIAVPAIVCTFWLWVRAQRTARAQPLGACGVGALCGVSFAFLAASWGAYPFVSNLIALHVALLAVLGRYSLGLHGSYVAFWTVGTALSTLLPVVPLRSLEQLAPFVVLCALPCAAALESAMRARGLGPGAAARVRALALVAAAVCCALAAEAAVSAGVVSALSVRVRSLFIAHRLTGNPLVDSVAEHSRTALSAYFGYVHLGLVVAPAGWAMCVWRWSDASLFVALYVVVSGYFSTKMVRLLLLVAPPVAVCFGMAAAALCGWSYRQVAWACRLRSIDLVRDEDLPALVRRRLAADAAAGRVAFAPEWWRAEALGALRLVRAVGAALVRVGPSGSSAVLERWRAAQREDEPPASKAAESPPPLQPQQPEPSPTPAGGVGGDTGPAREAPRPPFARSQLLVQLQPGGDLAPLRPVLGASALVIMLSLSLVFWSHASHMAVRASEPVVMTRMWLASGKRVVVDDYLQAYHWLREHTPADSRVLGWWDYGYHLNGIANRTSLADGNTWNLEHIALVGRCLLLPPAEAHALTRHLADYVLVWTSRHGNRWGGDDLAKAAHIAKVTASVYADVNASDVYMAPGLEAVPAEGLRRSLLYALHAHGILANAPTRNAAALAALGFEEAFTSEHHMARVFRVLRVSAESRRHVAEAFAAARACHALEGELHPRCREGLGYPPALKAALRGQGVRTGI